MADALLSPQVGGAIWAVSAGTIAVSSGRLRRQADDRRTPLMGVLGAFLFAVQMINFAIPGTGASGHLGGGLLLAILLGPAAAFLTVASVLVVQALFFADGGLLALGCNILNLAFFPAFVAYPLVYLPLVDRSATRIRRTVAAVVAAVVGLELGAMGVVLETLASGISLLPAGPFISLMLPIHLAIGIVEGVVTSAVVSFVATARPDLVPATEDATSAGRRSLRPLLATILAVALVTGGAVSRFASDRPDGLEWSIAAITGAESLPAPARGFHAALASLQGRLSRFPGYSLPNVGPDTTPVPADTRERSGTGTAGIFGCLGTMGLVLLGGRFLRKLRASAP